jgi:hypothetical protein
MDIPRFLSACVVLIVWLSSADAQTLSYITTPPGSFSHSTATAIAKTISEKAGIRTIVQAQAASGQEAVNSGSSDLSSTNSFDLQFFVTGTGDWEGKGKKGNIRMIARIAPIIAGLFVRTESDIKTVEQLKGRRVPKGFGAQVTAHRVVNAYLANAGLSYDDVNGVLTRNVVSGADDFAAGRLDTFLFAIGAAKVKQVDASVGGLRALPIDTSPAAVRRMRQFMPGSYPMLMQPSPNLKEVPVPTSVMAYDLVLFANVTVPEASVRKITEALHQNKKDLVAVFRGLQRFEPDLMAKDYEDLEYHPGAISYYRDKGLWPPRKDAH